MTATRASVLDLGSNSFHVLVADLDGRAITPVLRAREMLHLGRAVALTGGVPDADRRRAVDTVAHLAELARRAGAEQPIAVATAALRSADNGPEVIADLGGAAGVGVTVLDGDEEARLAYIGVRASIALHGRPVLVLDLGGGSLELAIGSGDRPAWSATTPLGASALSALVASDPPRRRELRELHRRIDAHLLPLVEQVRAHGPVQTVAIGGTVRALARIAAADEGAWLPATLNEFVLERDELARLAARLVALDLDGRVAIPGMKERRADHVHLAAVTLLRTTELLDIEALTISDWGLREGLLLDANGTAAAPSATELRRDEVERIRARFSPDDPHPGHVATLARQLFDATVPLHGLGATDREVLQHAATLHSIGESLALRRQQLHGAYLLQNAELRGFTPAEAAVLVTLVRFHPSRGIDRSFPAFAALGETDQGRTIRLLALLQVADGLDRAHDQAVERVSATLDDHALRLRLAGGGLHVTAGELQRRLRLFTEVFGVTVDVVDEGGS